MDQETTTDTAARKEKSHRKKKNDGSSGDRGRGHRSSPDKGSPQKSSPEKDSPPKSSPDKASPTKLKKERSVPKLVRTPSQRSLMRKSLGSMKSRGSLSPAQSIDISTKSSHAPSVSVTKTLAHLQAIPMNRSCAECRSPLLDSSQTFASFTPSLGELPSTPHIVSAVGEFTFNHEAFAPPGRPIRKEPIDPAILATQLLGGFGVFVCAACGAAHKSMGPKLSIVQSVIDTSLWTPEQVEFLLKAGGNARSWAVFERYMPESWQKRRPTNNSTHAERQVFIRAKYDALAFLTPTGGPLAENAWSHIVQSKPELERWTNKDLGMFHRITLYESKSGRQVVKGSPNEAALPSRLVDFFCVVGQTGRLVRGEIDRDLGATKSPDELSLEVKVIDCYPPPDAYNDMDFPEHVSTFVFPDGCRPREIQSTPTLFTFALTSANGQRLYGAAMHVYDDQMDTEKLREVLEDSGYTVPLPWWLHDVMGSPNTSPAGSKRPSELVYIPKCLVVLSHYPFFDLWRRFLTQLYRISMVKAPLPVERYIANFVCEVPLPPQGKVEVRFGFTSDDPWSISRPAVNDLPLANFSYRPLFASLSVGNIMVVCACLMQETRVALLSSHYGLLGPVAEALLSLLFPFEWQGMYIPIMPFTMLDILDAPVPFLVGLHSRYLSEVPSRNRPRGVVFVNLDRDELHLGFDDQAPNANEKNMPSRPAPELPEKDALKLKAQLEECGGMAYLVPSTGTVGRILTGNGDLLQNFTRPLYTQMSSVDKTKSLAPRMQTLSKTDKAFPDNRQLNPISGFLSEQGHMSDLTSRNDAKQRVKKRNLFKRRRKSASDVSNGEVTEETDTTCLLEMEEPEGFSGSGIRNAFLRFFVTIFNQYEKYLLKESNRGSLFRNDEFLLNLGLPPGSNQFVSRMLGTQMFQRFLQERKDNPTSPSILFFDESIIAKNNRSKMTMLSSGGKQKTPFLDDTSGNIREVFTPAPPSNWGLPDDGHGYHYGSFPTLRADRFGNVRPPKQWPQQDAGTYRTVARAAALKQQELIAKAIGPTSSVPTLLTSSRGRPSIRDMEWAIQVLSTDAESQNSRLEVKVESRTSAQQQVLAARRKQGILVDIIISLQAYCRMFIARRRYERQKKALISVQRRSRRTPPKKEQQAFRETISCVIVVQKVARCRAAQNRYKALQTSTVLVQRIIRGFMARQKFHELEAAMLLQRWIRGEIVRWYMSRLTKACLVVQSSVRGRRSRFACMLLMSDICRAQAQSRGYLTRRLMSGLIKKRTSRFKQQIFLLWQRAHTPLAYRTKMWPMLDGSSFISLTLAEAELQRLWTELDITFSPSLRSRNSSLKNDDHCSLAQEVGLVMHSYLRFTMVQAMIESAKRNDGATAGPWFHGEGSPHWKKAADRETLERLQIYERLCAETDKATLEAIYNCFDIASGDKMKKTRLVECLWANQAYASRSVSVMVAIFPELQYGTYMNFITPSKKGMKRYHVGKSIPLPLDRSMQVDVVRDQLIKSNMKEFAMAYAGRVPTLMMRLDESERKKSNRFSRQRSAAMYARRISSWPLCRYRIIMEFLYPK